MNRLINTLAVLSLFAQLAGAQAFNPVIDVSNSGLVVPAVPAPKAVQEAGDKSYSARLAAAADPQEKLKNLFEEGIPALEKELSGWHSGRSYDAVRKTFTGALLAFWKAPAADNTGGPLFQQESVPMAIVMNESDPAFFDKLPYDQVLRVRYMINSRERVFMLKFPGAKGFYEDAGSRVMIEERVAGGYIVERMTVLEKATETRHEVYSYYFKNVTPKN
ncbi:MAG TPA: hypothetical protein PKI19_09005 [Elusimicrobiales bacterium]|nr:hypothetical protein [Elusimicrobiales bacterium]